MRRLISLFLCGVWSMQQAVTKLKLLRHQGMLSDVSCVQMTTRAAMKCSTWDSFPSLLATCPLCLCPLMNDMTPPSPPVLLIFSIYTRPRSQRNLGQRNSRDEPRHAKLFNCTNVLYISSEPAGWYYLRRWVRYFHECWRRERQLLNIHPRLPIVCYLMKYFPDSILVKIKFCLPPPLGPGQSGQCTHLGSQSATG